MGTENQESEQSSRTRAELRNDLIDAARNRLRGEALDQFSTKNVVEDCNTSRQMIYTIFGGKAELLSAVYQETAKRLAEQLDEVEAEDPVEKFFFLGQQYRQFMLENAALFDRIFSLDAYQNFREKGPLVTRTSAHEHFDEVLSECQDRGIIPEDEDVEKMTDEIWAGVNGVIRLQLIGYFDDEDTARDSYYNLAFSWLSGQSAEDLMPFEVEDHEE